MNDRRYRAALIGLGRIADTIDDEVIGDGWLVPFSHMGSYMDVPEVQVVGAADLYTEQREAFGERWTIPDTHLYENYLEMLEREKPDIVSICTSAAPRAKITLDIVRMVREGRTGVKCIWVEKPMATSLEEADAMVEGCREAGIILMMNAMRASDVYYRRGTGPLSTKACWAKCLQITAHGAGNLSHMGVHWLGAMCVLAGGNERGSLGLWGRWRVTKKPQPMQTLPVTPIWHLKTVPVGFCRMLPSAASTWTLDAIGEHGTIHLRNANDGYEFELWKMGKVTDDAPATPVRHIFPRPQRIWSAGVGQVKDAINCIETGKTPNCSGDMGRHLFGACHCHP